ncbi:YHYH protein [Phaeobacter sp. HF9A]|uniref:YHYH protein n=1 Tax=Phaeobacter sp. HF9A TaxID=2721561 RepID=UPI00143002E5|nr:YHYH protein [Phaeobacter sp. HF9A]NIZ14868.1 YHYH protein [Phaeobacter sp. HF9A]
MKARDIAKLSVLTVTLGVGVAVQVGAQGMHRMRAHTATEAQPLALVPANKSPGSNRVQLSDTGARVRVQANGIPDHAVGQFPNRDNPNRIRKQKYTFETGPAEIKRTAQAMQRGGVFGVAVNGVPFDPVAAEFWQGRPDLGWQYEALGGAVPLGLDANYAHVQPSGAYHYHGLPTGLMSELGWSADRASPLIGYAADGFPIYVITAEQNGKVVEMTSSWRLKRGLRPGAPYPSGGHDGAFVQDYRYVAGSGRLDECNGAKVVTAEYPQGTYAYFLTRDFPVVPRCFRGEAGRSFIKRGP